MKRTPIPLAVISRILAFLRVRIRKQINRRILRISECVYLDTFDIRDNKLNLLYRPGGDMGWSFAIDLRVINALLTECASVEIIDSSTNKFVFKGGVFFTKREENCLKIELVPSRSSITYLMISFSMITEVAKSTLRELIYVRTLD